MVEDRSLSHPARMGGTRSRARCRKHPGGGGGARMRRVLTAYIILSLILTLFNPGGSVASAFHYATHNRPVLFIHGLDPDWSDGAQADCRQAWDPMAAFLDGYPQAGTGSWDRSQFRYVSFYHGDKDCHGHGTDNTTIEHHGWHRLHANIPARRMVGARRRGRRTTGDRKAGRGGASGRSKAAAHRALPRVTRPDRRRTADVRTGLSLGRRAPAASPWPPGYG